MTVLRENGGSGGEDGAYHARNASGTDNRDYGASQRRERRLCRRGGLALLTQRALENENESVTPSRVSPPHLAMMRDPPV